MIISSDYPWKALCYIKKEDYILYNIVYTLECRIFSGEFFHYRRRKKNDWFVWFDKSYRYSTQCTMYILRIGNLKRFLKHFSFFSFIFLCIYSTLRHLPPLRFHCVRGCWDLTQDCCDFGITARRSNHSAIFNHFSSQPHFLV